MLQPETGRKKIPRRRWAIALLLGVGVLVNYFDRVNLSVSRDALEASFGISAVMFGWLSGAYNWTYMLLQLPSGPAAGSIWRAPRWHHQHCDLECGFLRNGDRHRRQRFIFWRVFLLGIGEAPTFPANSKAIGYWFPAK